MDGSSSKPLNLGVMVCFVFINRQSNGRKNRAQRAGKIASLLMNCLLRDEAIDGRDDFKRVYHSLQLLHNISEHTDTKRYRFR